MKTPLSRRVTTTKDCGFITQLAVVSERLSLLPGSSQPAMKSDSVCQTSASVEINGPSEVNATAAKAALFIGNSHTNLHRSVGIKIDVASRARADTHVG